VGTKSLAVERIGFAGALALLSLATQPLMAAEDQSVPGADKLEEVVVTSQKELTNLQKTPAAVTAVTAEELTSAGVTNLTNIQMLAPAVRFDIEGNNTQVFIRGVGANLDFQNEEPSVGFIFAGAYMPREATTAAFFDLAQVEVLPGPQGTLYGRSAIGGTVTVTPVWPAHNSDGTALLEVGNYAMVHGTYAQNIPLTSTLALRPAVDYISNNGVENSGADAKRDFSARLSALYDPNDSTSMLLWGQFAEKKGHPFNLVNKGLDPITRTYSEGAFLRSNPWDDTRTGPIADTALFGEPVADHQSYRMFMTGGRIETHIAGITITDIPSYVYLDSAPNYWLGTIRSQLNAHINQVANELRFSNPGGSRVKWLAGLYLYRILNDGVFYLFTNQPFVLRQSNITSNEIKNIAGFGQATFSATDRLRFIVGGRYGTDKRDAAGLAPDALGALPWTFSDRFSHFDWKVGTEYDASASAMLYATIQTGNKPGSYNEVPPNIGYTQLVKPSNLTAYTIGAKSRLLDDRLQLNAEFFYYDYRDLAVQAYDISAPFNGVFNAQKIRIDGGQIDTLYRVNAEGRLDLSLAYTPARNTKFVTPAGQDFSGLSPPYAADQTVIFGYSQGVRVGTGIVRGRLDTRWESGWFADYVHNRGTYQASNTKVDASLTYEATSHWTIGAWCKNLGNKAVIAATAAAGIPGPATAYLEEPRTYGIRITAAF